ncbi:MAG: response regulator [Chloroflexota bacterium]
MDELKGIHVFVVEDDPTNMAVNAVTLKRSGAKVTQDMWNVGAVDKLLERMPVDVILLDLMLRHNMNGYDIFNEIKAHPDLQAIPVIAVSAADPAIEIPKAKELGFAGFIGKPIRPHLFAGQIAACIAGKPVWYARNGVLEDL